MQRNCNRNSRLVNLPCECKFSLKKTYTKYELLKTTFNNFDHQKKNNYCTEHMSYRTVIFEQNYHWLLVELFFSRSLYALDC